MGTDILPENLPGIKQNDFVADILKIMLDFIVVEYGIIGENILKEYP